MKNVGGPAKGEKPFASKYANRLNTKEDETTAAYEDNTPSLSSKVSVSTENPLPAPIASKVPQKAYIANTPVRKYRSAERDRP